MGPRLITPRGTVTRLLPVYICKPVIPVAIGTESKCNTGIFGINANVVRANCGALLSKKTVLSIAINFDAFLSCISFDVRYLCLQK